MPGAIQIDPALLAAGAWLWTGSGWVRCSGDSQGRLRVNLAGSEIILNTYTYPTAGTHNVAVQNWPGTQYILPQNLNYSIYTAGATGQIKSSAGWIYFISIGHLDSSPRSFSLRNGLADDSPVRWISAYSGLGHGHYPFFPPLYFDSAIRFVTNSTNVWVTVGYS